MSDPAPKICDNTSVGVIITNDRNEFLMFDRNTFPPGTAPVADHHSADPQALAVARLINQEPS